MFYAYTFLSLQFWACAEVNKMVVFSTDLLLFVLQTVVLHSILKFDLFKNHSIFIKIYSHLDGE